jgi:ribonuclease HII
MEFANFERESELQSLGFVNIGGVDEAGRGPWSGPVSAGCVVIHREDQMVDGIADSKKLTEKKRELYFDDIKEKSSGWGVGLVSAKEIDKIGIQKAVQKAMLDAIHQAEEMVGSKCDYILADGSGILDLPPYKIEKVIKGDMKHYTIAAGSILAKVTRDRLMVEYANKYPEYAFEKHKGYGTKVHREALKLHGACEIHRKSYKPIAKIIDENN